MKCRCSAKSPSWLSSTPANRHLLIAQKASPLCGGAFFVYSEDYFEDRGGQVVGDANRNNWPDLMFEQGQNLASLVM